MERDSIKIEMEKLKKEKEEQEEELNNLKNDLKNTQEDNNFLKNEKASLEKKLINEINENKAYREKEKKYEERSVQYYLSLEENKKTFVINNIHILKYNILCYSYYYYYIIIIIL